MRAVGEVGEMGKDRNADGLRGIAAFNVTISHFMCAFLPTVMHGNYPGVFKAPTHSDTVTGTLSNPVLSLMYNGHFPVVVFFVLSGYVLTIPYFRDSNTKIMYGRIWGRYLRLNIPIFFAVMLSFAIYAGGFYQNGPAAELAGGNNWLADYLPPGLGFYDALRQGAYQSIIRDVNTFDPPLWTLQIEFTGSLVLLGFFAISPPRMTVPLAALAIILVAVFGFRSIYYLSMFAGAFLNLFRCSRATAIALFAAGCYLGAYRYDSVLYSILPQFGGLVQTTHADKVIYNTIGAVFLTAAVVNGSGSRFFSGAIPQFLGQISYALYLTHFLLLLSLNSWLYLRMGTTYPALLLNFAIYIAAALAFAKVFERLIDRNAIQLTRRFVQVLYGRK